MEVNDTSQSYILDTNFFNEVLDGNVRVESLEGRTLLVTGIQLDELKKTKSVERRQSLLLVFRRIDPSIEFASSFAFDIEGAGFDQAYWNDGSGNYERMLARLQELDRGKGKHELNQHRDILIAETSIKNGFTLVSNDNNLRQVVSEFGGCTISSLDF